MNNKANEQIRLMNCAINGTISVYGILARRYGLNYNSLMVVYTIENNEKCTQKLICDILQLPKSTVHSILLDFVKKEYMTLQTEAENKKEKIICLTAYGKSYFDEIMRDVHKNENKALEKIGSDICTQLVTSNLAFYEAFREEAEKHE